MGVVTLADRIRAHELFAEWTRTRDHALLDTIARELSFRDHDMRLVKQAIRDAAKPRKHAGRGRPRKDRSVDCVCPKCGAELSVTP